MTSDVVARPDLRRLFDPKTIAIVGAREGSTVGENWRGTLDSEAEVHLVNPSHREVFGRRTVASLAEIDSPIDVVLCLVSAERAVEVAEQAVHGDVGGMVLIAAGFAELGTRGQLLQQRLVSAALAGDFPVVGPNGAGYVSVPKRVDMTFLAPFARRPGGASLVTHSGGLLEAVAAAADRAGGLGLNLLISAGNEAVTDVADYIDFLVDDPHTSVIMLALEAIRRPEAFFAAARRAHTAGKPLIAVKIGRTAQSAKMALSHTGALTADSWVYDLAFRQANIVVADEINDLVDRAQILEQLPREKWTAVRGVAVMAGSGGMAALGADVATEQGISVPDVPHLDEWIGSIIPGADVANPFDSRGLAKDEVFRAVYEKFAASAEFDAAVFFGQFADWDESGATLRADQVVTSPLPGDKAVVISPFGGIPGRWLDRYRARGVAIGNGPTGVFRGLAAMASFMRSDPRSHVKASGEASAVPEPECDTVVADGSSILSLETTMELLASHGIPVAPYCLLRAGEPVALPSFEPPFVVKLADVPHRVAADAVRLDVSRRELPVVVDALREHATAENLPDTVVIQPFVRGVGELFVGGQGNTELGPVTVFGVGGTLVETQRAISGRLAPFDEHVAGTLLDDFADSPLLHWIKPLGPHGRRALTSLLVSVSHLLAGARSWLQSLDINPLIVTPTGYVAVDGLAVVTARPDGQEGKVPRV